MDGRIDRMKIGVIGLSTGAGAGFVSSCLAGALAEGGNYRPAMLEMGKGGLYDSLAMDKHFAGKDYFRFFQAMVDNKSIRGRANVLYGINWALKSPEEKDISLDLLKMIRIANHALGDMIICKISGIKEESLWRLLWDMDRIMVIIDPLPSKMLAAYKFLCALRASGLPILYIVNKMNGGVSHREMLDYLRLKKLLYFPLIDQNLIYGAEYSCRFVYNLPSVKSEIREALNNLIQELQHTYSSYL